MLTEEQTDRVWNGALAAKVRSLYFADLASSYTRRKQIITGITFFLSSGAAAALVAKMPPWVPLVLSVISAVFMAYSMAVNLDRAATTMAKLRYAWSQIEADFRRLWNHWYEDNAEEVLENILIHSREASELGITEAPYQPGLVEKWRTFVHEQYGLIPTRQAG
jgi:hypothetical protein